MKPDHNGPMKLVLGWLPTRQGRVGIALLVLLGVLLPACGGDGFTYVGSSDGKAFFKVPASWAFFDKRELLVASGLSLSGQANQQFQWLIGFDAAPEPSLEHLALGNIPNHPVVLAQAQGELPFSFREDLSLRGLRNLFYPVDRLIQSNAAELLAHEDIVLPGGLHGSRVLYDVVPQGVTGVAWEGSVLRIDQTTIVDAGTRTIYSFLVRCESHCYRDNKAVIDQIVESWTVKER